MRSNDLPFRIINMLRFAGQATAAVPVGVRISDVQKVRKRAHRRTTVRTTTKQSVGYLGVIGPESVAVVGSCTTTTLRRIHSILIEAHL